MERLIREVGDAVGERLRLGEQSVDDVARELHEKVRLSSSTPLLVSFGTPQKLTCSSLIV